MKYIYLLIVVFISISITFCDDESVSKYANSTVADHTVVEGFNSIPDNVLAKIRSMTIQIVGQSHGRQIPRGLELLAEIDSKYKVQIDIDLAKLTDTGALKVLRSQRSGSGWYGNFTDDNLYWNSDTAKFYTERTAKYCIDQGQPLTVSIWCWCWDIVDGKNFFSGNEVFNDNHINEYISAIRQFNNNAQINETKFLYVTSITDASPHESSARPNEYAWNVTKYNAVIREAANSDGAYLFDQASIENWSFDNSSQQVNTYNGHTLYLRHSDYGEEPANNPIYSPGHTNEANCIRKAKALWVLLAKLAIEK